MKTRSRQLGFSLIELLVAIGIVSVLASVVIASMQGARQTAEIAKTKSDVAQIKLALVQYVQDYGAFPACSNSSTFPQACCIGGSSCQVGVLSASTELTAMGNQSRPNYAQTPEALVASTYYRQHLDKPVLYSCSSGVLINNKELCNGTVIITYLLGNTVTPEVLSDPSTNTAQCNDPLFAEYYTNPKGPTCNTPVICNNPDYAEYQSSQSCTTQLACNVSHRTDRQQFVEYWTGANSPCSTPVGCFTPGDQYYHTSHACSTGGGGNTTIYGCTDPNATNYNSSATANNGSCTYSSGGSSGGTIIYGCTDPNASNYNASATANNGSCTYSSGGSSSTGGGGGGTISGCTDPSSANYNAAATVDDGSCTYSGGGSSS